MYNYNVESNGIGLTCATRDVQIHIHMRSDFMRSRNHRFRVWNN